MSPTVENVSGTLIVEKRSLEEEAVDDISGELDKATLNSPPCNRTFQLEPQTPICDDDDVDMYADIADICLDAPLDWGEPDRDLGTELANGELDWAASVAASDDEMTGGGVETELAPTTHSSVPRRSPKLQSVVGVITPRPDKRGPAVSGQDVRRRGRRGGRRARERRESNLVARERMKTNRASDGAGNGASDDSKRHARITSARDGHGPGIESGKYRDKALLVRKLWRQQRQYEDTLADYYNRMRDEHLRASRQDCERAFSTRDVWRAIYRQADSLRNLKTDVCYQFQRKYR